MAQQPAHRKRKAAHKLQPQQNQRSLKRKREDEDISALETKVYELDVSSKVSMFSDLPLSKATARGLSASHFEKLTAIQQKAIILALRGSDILGAAKTGSGKTIAFLVPLLEALTRKRWTADDGLGGLVLSPTRELAIQTFEVLRKIGRHHNFSAGLVIGGKSLSEERERLGRMNILVATPGRILQHLDQTAELEVDNLQMLILDEADRILDLGFQQTVDAICEHLPQERQTLLFSATQTKKVSDLARLSLKDPEYVAVHETATFSTPETLKQSWCSTPLPEKLDTLWSFLRANTKAKILVFLSSGKQVRYYFETFRHLQPGIPLLHLHGRQKQTARLDITRKFIEADNACLISTDLAARGLDFPAVDWVIQVDCPEDADTYIHRAGRSARFERDGNSVVFLEPSEEEAMLSRLKHKKVPIEQIQVREKKQQSIQNLLQNMCFKDPEIKYLGQKAFIAYVKSIHIMKDKEVFDLQKLPLEDFATSLGLPGAPRIKFQKGDDAKRLKNASRQTHISSSEDEENESQQKPKTVRTKFDRMFERQNQGILSSHYANLVDRGADGEGKALNGDAEGDDKFFNAKRPLLESPLSPVATIAERPAPKQEEQQSKRSIALIGGKALSIDSKRREKLLKSKKQLLKYQGKGSKLVFDDDGNPHKVYEMKDEEDFKKAGNVMDQRQKFVDEERARVRNADLTDKALAKEKRKAKRERRKERERDLDDGMETKAILAPFEEDENQKDDTYLNEDSDIGGSEADRVEDDFPKPSKRKKKRRKMDTVKENGISDDVSLGQGSGNLENLEALATSYL